MTRGCTSAQGKEVGGGERAAAVRRRGDDPVVSRSAFMFSVLLKDQPMWMLAESAWLYASAVETYTPAQKLPDHNDIT